MKNLAIRLRFVIVALGLIILGGEQRASAATLCVKPGGGGGCFPSIQAAVAVAVAGDTINVSAGTYTEQVVIDKNLKLLGKKGAIIKAPSPMVVAGPLNTKSIVRIAGTVNVTIDKFTITGPGDGGCGSLHHGIKVEGGATARITNNHITDIRDEPFSGCQNGQGIFVGRQSESTTGIATILNNVIDEYQKGGIVVDNTGSSATISDNEITGVGPTPTIAQNGIQVSRGAKATVKNNEVSENIYTGVNASSTGILLFGPGQNVVVNNNSVVNNDVGISSTTAGGTAGEESPVRKAEITKNVVDNSTYDGIDLIDTINSTVKSNRITVSGVDGIFVDVGAVGNTIKDNQMSASGEHDAHDDNGSGANTWTGNDCGSAAPQDQNQPGLCS